MLLGEAFQLIGEELCSRSALVEVSKVVDVILSAERLSPVKFPCCRDGKLNLSVGMGRGFRLRLARWRPVTRGSTAGEIPSAILRSLALKWARSEGDISATWALNSSPVITLRLRRPGRADRKSMTLSLMPRLPSE
jgi:hypothetical protein